MKTSIVALALGMALACPVTAYAGENTNIFEELFYGSDYSHRGHDMRVDGPSSVPFKPRETDGLSRDPNACASYGCIDSGG